MNINELSDSTVSVTLTDERKRQKNRRLVMIILSAAVLLLAAVLVGVYYFDRTQEYEKYAEGIISNDRLILQVEDGDTKLYNAHVPGIEFVATHDPTNKRIQTQAIRASSSDDVSFNLCYSYVYGDGEEPYYSVSISERDSEDRMKTAIVIGVRFTHELELIGCSGDKNDGMTALTDEEARAYFEEHRSEVAELLQSMYDFFGEEHFKE